MIAEEDVAGIDTGNVTAWLAEHVGATAAVPRSTSSPAATPTSPIGVTDADGRRLVLRRPPLGHVLATAHDMGREHRIIAGLQGTDVPVAPGARAVHRRRP